MSNKSRLQANNTNLQSLIDKANELPDASSSSGASVETCTVTITTDSYMSLFGCGATIYTVNGISTNNMTNSGYQLSEPYIIENVVCGSSLSLFVNNNSLMGVTVTGATCDASFYGLGILCFKIDDNATNVTIYVYNND